MLGLSGLDKSRDFFRSFVGLEGSEQSLCKVKSGKKLKSNHVRTNSVKSPSSSKHRSLHSLEQFLGMQKLSIKPHSKAKRDTGEESKSKQNTIKTKSRLKQMGDIAEITSRIMKMVNCSTPSALFQQTILQMFYNFADSNILIAKAEMLTILKYIFGYFSKTASTKSVAVQTDSVDLEEAKKTAKRLIVNSDQQAPTDSLQSQLILLCQKELLLDEILTILNEEDIDLNNLLSITLERIEANFYEPPSDMSINDGVSLTRFTYSRGQV